jgi:hypothetical protein
VAQNQDADHLDVYERWARDRLSSILGPLRLVDRPGGQPGVHDFEADLADHLVVAVEVTGEVDSQRLSQAASIEHHLSPLTLPGSRWLWLVGLTDRARAKMIKSYLPQLLRDLENEGRESALDVGDLRDPFVDRLVALGIESVRARPAKAGHEGTVIVQPGTYGGYGWDGRNVDMWLKTWVASRQGVNKLEKLGRSGAAQRHLVIVLDPFSEAGLGIPLGLRTRQERGAADYVMPTFTPPEQLTNVWIIPPPYKGWEGLAWSRDAKWTVLSALASGASLTP